MFRSGSCLRYVHQFCCGQRGSFDPEQVSNQFNITLRSTSFPLQRGISSRWIISNSPRNPQENMAMFIKLSKVYPNCMTRYSFAIIGGGPAGFYMAKLLSKHPYHPIVHIYQKQMLPFGLLRYGVAPDHLAIKKAENTLAEVSKYPFFRYFGNTKIDEERFKYLRKNYSGIIYAHGASQNKMLGFEDFPARKFIYWYNSYPGAQGVSLSSARDVVVVGNGNVSIDIARILLKDPLKLTKTDINLETLQQLKRSQVKNVSVVGRRGIVQSSFTLKQVRELKTEGFQMYMLKQEVEKSMNEASRTQATIDSASTLLNTLRANKRKLTFLAENCKLCADESELEELTNNQDRKLILRFLLSPIGREGKDICFHRTELTGEPFKQVAKPTEQIKRIKADILISSMGFKSESVMDEHFNRKRSVANHANGVVIKNDKVDIGVYATGWVKTGAVGIIDSTLLNCEETYNNLRIHMEEGVLEPKEPQALETEDQLDFQDYLKIKQQQFRRGGEQQRHRVKMSDEEIRGFLNKNK